MFMKLCPEKSWYKLIVWAMLMPWAMLIAWAMLIPWAMLIIWCRFVKDLHLQLPRKMVNLSRPLVQASKTKLDWQLAYALLTKIVMSKEVWNEVGKGELDGWGVGQWEHWHSVGCSSEIAYPIIAIVAINFVNADNVHICMHILSLRKHEMIWLL